ncbi:MAG: rhodanese-like domain-containing protein [Coriobacteriia bacterium]
MTNKHKNTSNSKNKNKNVYVIWGIAALAVIGLLFLMFKPASSGATIENVSAEKAAELVATGVQAVDVRTAGEFQAGHLPGAVNLPVDQLATLAGSLDPTKPVVVYCATGSRSISAVGYFESAGFTKIYHMNEGMIAWTGSVERGNAVAVAPPVEPETLTTPVMYEFYTDW